MKQNIDIKAVAARIPDTYDYLDSMPLEGWIWEFVRRSEHYRERYANLKKGVEAGVSGERLLSMVNNFVNEARTEGIILFSEGMKRSHKNSEDCYLSVPLPMERYFDSQSFNMLNEEVLEPNAYIPNPDKRFVDFKIRTFLLQGTPFDGTIVSHSRHGLIRTSLVPHPVGREPDFKIYASLSKLLLDQASPKSEVSKIELKDGKADVTLSEKPDPEVMYIAVSRKAKYTDIQKYLLSEVKAYLKPPDKKLRVDKWKYYLMVYDLRIRYGESMVNKDIANIFATAYPAAKSNKKRLPAYFKAKNITNHYDDALALINGDYRKYLLSTK